MRRYFGFCFIALVLLATGSPGHAAESGVDSSITVTDFRGRQIEMAAPATRIVCLIESALSGLYMLGAQDAVVGISTNIYQDAVFRYYAAMDQRVAERAIPAAGNWDFVNVESVVSLAPDLVIIWSHQTESIAALEEKGLAVYGVFIQSFDDIYKEIRDFGAVTGKRDRAEALISQTRSEIADFAKQIEKIEKPSPSVYFMWAQGPLETAGKSSSANDLIEIAGGKNVCGHIDQEHLVLNIENVLTWNPEVVVMWYNTRMDPADLMGNPLWQSVSAVRNGRVHELPEPFTCDFWTLKFQFAIKAVAKWCHPDELPDLDLDAERRRMLKALYGHSF